MKNVIRISKIGLVAFLSMLATAGFNQTFEEFQEKHRAAMQRMEQEQKEFQQNRNQQFKEFVQKRDQEFSEYLKQRWSEYERFKGLQPDEKPKPVIAPRYDPLDTIMPIKVLTGKLTEAFATPLQEYEPRSGTMVYDDKTYSFSNIEIPFFGNNLLLNFDPSVIVQPPSEISDQTIGNYWSLASRSDYYYIINQLTGYSRKMNLNDWGYYLLVRNASRQLHPNSLQGANLLTWFLMNQSGYKTRIGYYEEEILLMLPVIQAVYDIDYITAGGVKYYLFEGSAPDIFSYNQDYPGATRSLDLNIYSPMILGNEIATRSIVYKYKSHSYTLDCRYNLNTIEFFKQYPSVNLVTYFNASVSQTAKESIEEALMPLIIDLDEVEAVNLLLNFTQTVFNYQTDHEQFGHEKFFFAEEILHYPYSDCEDRSVFFAWLVRDLLKLKVVGVEYGDHVATAVHFTSDCYGNYYVYKGEKYTICDPTYINAPVGMVMEEYLKEEAMLHELNSSEYYTNVAGSIWEKVYSYGGYRAGNIQDIAFDDDGNAVVTGFFKGHAFFGNTLLKVDNDAHGVFVAKFNNRAELIWVTCPASQVHAAACYVALDDDQNIYISGTFSNSITFGTVRLEAAESSGVFLAKFDSRGTALWADKIAIDNQNPEMPFIFTAAYSKLGQRLGTKVFPEDADYNDYGISIQPGRVTLTGSTYTNTGLRLASINYEATKDFDPVRTLKEENDRLVAAGYNPAIAGLFATLNLIQINNVTITGKIVQEALNRFNPDFKRLAPNIFKCIAQINFLKNDQGIVFINLEGGKNLVIDRLKIANNASVKVIRFSNGNLQIEVLKGISVGKAFVWFPLNFIRLMKTNGDLLFDYSGNNAQITYNLKKDILD